MGAHIVFADESGFLLIPQVVKNLGPPRPDSRTSAWLPPGQNLRHLGSVRQSQTAKPGSFLSTLYPFHNIGQEEFALRSSLPFHTCAKLKSSLSDSV